MPPAKRRVIDIGICKPVSCTSIASEPSSHSEGPDYTAWHTKLDEYLITPFILMTTAMVRISKEPLVAQLESDKSSFYSSKPPADLPPAFDVFNYTDPEAKECNYLYYTKHNKQPPAGLVYFHVARFYQMELSFLDNKNSQSPLDYVDNKCHEFLQGITQTYCNLSSLDEPHIIHITKDQKPSS